MNKYLRTESLILIGLALFSCQSETKQSKPNIILIITDDQGYADYSAYGGANDVRTPNMDRLAKTGVRFTDGYATSPICSASRSAIITGAYQQRWGNFFYGGTIFPESRPAIPEILSQHGYRCIKIGKTHYAQILDNNNSIKNPDELREFPLNHGYEEFLGFCAHRHDYFKLKEEDNWVKDPTDKLMSQFGPLWRNRTKQDFDGYTTDIFGDEAVSQILKDDSRPFFMELSFNAVHHPIYQAPDKYLEMFGLEEFPDWDHQEESFMDYHARTCWRGEEDPDGRKRYLANLACLDDNIGKVIDALEKSGKRENTLIIFISDNGGSQNTYADNGILNGHKFILLEGGIRTVFTLSWPQKIKRSKVIETPVSHMDIMPTCLAAAGLTIANDYSFDGKNLFPVIKDRGIIHHEVLFWDTGNELAVRKSGWKLHIVKEDNHYRSIHLDAGIYLYNLNEDPEEKVNLAEKHPEKVKELRDEHNNWKLSL